MNTHFTLACPACSRPLDIQSDLALACHACGRHFPQTFGIPDLRGSRGVDNPAIIGMVEKLLENYAGMDFAGLLEIRLRNAPNYADLREHVPGYILSLNERGRAMVEMFRSRAQEFFPGMGNAAALDIGCGSGAGLLALSRHYEFVAGIDPSLPDLILARKALETAGVSNFQLVQAYGQKIPFVDQSFDHTNALNVLEHVFGLEPVLNEIYRTLKPGGVFTADSRNRFDPFLPEPHVKIRWVGMMPRRWQKKYVLWRLGIGYDTTCLLSYGELRRGLMKSFHAGWRIVFPYVNAYGGPVWANAWLKRLEQLPGLSTLALWIFPSHLALACRLTEGTS